jgi:hypothetical protein
MFKDRLGTGFGMGCVCLVIFYALSHIVGRAVELTAGPSFVSLSIYYSWGVTPWIALIPLILRQQAAGHPLTVRGLKISGYLGLFLSVASAGYLFWGLSIALNNIP